MKIGKRSILLAVVLFSFKWDKVIKEGFAFEAGFELSLDQALSSFESVPVFPLAICHWLQMSSV